MKKILLFLRTTLIGGVWFLLPIFVFVFVIGKVHKFTSALVMPIAQMFPVETVAGVAVARLLAVLVIVLFCFLAGLFAITPTAKSIVNWLEEVILSNLPGYSFMKGLGGNVLGIAEKTAPQVVMARIEDAWQIGFLMEKVEENLFAVYVPGAPSPWSGSVYFMENDRFKKINISPREAMRCVKGLGIGSAKLLSGRME